ncbi:MAG: hypothetical protein DRI83_00075 [Bacteroidetes bacterium]|nr:MAG: hypothetical protein DRI83_00075 [Bacteroidota bacterium]
MKLMGKKINSNANPGKKCILSPFLFIRLIGIALFIFILTNINLEELWDNIRKVEIGFLFYGILFQLILLLAKGMRWHLMNKGGRSTYSIIRSYGEFFESYAIGVITPGRLGELVKAGHAEGKKSTIETVFRIIIERGIDIGFFVIVAGAAFLFAYTGLIPVIPAIIILIAGSIIFILSMVLMKSDASLSFTQNLLNKLPFLKLDLKFSFRHLDNSNFLFVIILSLISNFSAFLSCYMLALGLNFELSLLFVSGGIAIAGLINMLPITIMGLGTREATFLLLFKPMAEPLILAFSGLVFLVAQISGGLIALLLGQVFLIMTRHSEKRIRKK